MNSLESSGCNLKVTTGLHGNLVGGGLSKNNKNTSEEIDNQGGGGGASAWGNVRDFPGRGRYTPSPTEAGSIAGWDEPPHNGGMEARVSALEEAVKNLPTKTDLNELRQATKADFAGLRADFAGLRSEFSSFKSEVHKSVSDLRIDLTKTQGDLRTEMTKGFGEVRSDLHKSTIDVQRWMIVTVISLFLGFSGLFFTMSNATKQPTAPTPTQQAPIIINVPSSSPAVAPSTAPQE